MHSYAVFEAIFRLLRVAYPACIFFAAEGGAAETKSMPTVAIDSAMPSHQRQPILRRFVKERIRSAVLSSEMVADDCVYADEDDALKRDWSDGIVGVICQSDGSTAPYTMGISTPARLYNVIDSPTRDRASASVTVDKSTPSGQPKPLKRSSERSAPSVKNNRSPSRKQRSNPRGPKLAQNSPRKVGLA
jgi:hypothetical protein